MNEIILENKKHYPYIDAVRVFAIIMVMVLHCIFEYYNDISNTQNTLWSILSYVNELTRTGVPLFFMISGFLLLNEDIKSISQFYKKRFLKVLVPFLIYDIFYYVVFSLANGKTLSFYIFLKEIMVGAS